MTEELKQVSGEAESRAETETMDSPVADTAEVTTFEGSAIEGSAIEGSGGSDFVVGQAPRVISPPPAGQTETIQLAPGERFQLAANPATVNLAIRGDDLILGFDLDGDGVPDSFVVLEDLVLLAGGANPPVLMVAGEPIGVDLLVSNAQALAQTDQGGPGATLQTAADDAGPLGGGATEYDDNFNNLIDLLPREGVIPPVELQFGLIELVDEPPLLLEEDSPPQADPVLTPASVVVDGGEGGGLPEALQDALNALGIGGTGAIPGNWLTLGSVSTKGASFGITPDEGSAQLALQASGASQAEIEAFFGLAAGTLDGLDGIDDATDGAAVKTTFSVLAGDQISIQWNFLDLEQYDGSESFNDFAFIYIDGFGVIKLADVLGTDSGAIETEFGTVSVTGYTNISIFFGVGGDYTIGFGVMNEGDTAVDSGLLIDNVVHTSGETETVVGFEGGGSDVVFYKQLVVDGSIGDDDLGVIADFGGADAETALGDLVFTLLSPPTFGQLILVSSGGTSFLNPGDTFSSDDTVWWIATEQHISDFLSGEGAPEFLPDVNFDYSVTDAAGNDATAPVTITLPPPQQPRAALGVFQDDCLNEDTEGALFFSAHPTDGASKISQIVISGFPIGDAADAWVVDESSVSIDGHGPGDFTASYNALTGELTITFLTANFTIGEPVTGTVNVTPNPDSDVDQTLTIEATAINGAGSATDIEDSLIPVDADADGAEGGAGDDGDGVHLSVQATASDSDDDGSSFQPEEIGSLNIKATFDDFLDGSETHTIQVFAPAGFTILEINEAGLPAGVSLVSNDGSIAIFDIDTTDGVGSVDFDIAIQNTGAEGNTADFLVRALAEETNTGDVECEDGGEGGLFPVEGDNVAFVEDIATVSLADVAPPEVSLSLYGDEDCIEEDSLASDFTNQVTLTVNPDGDDLLTEIVITGLQSDWTYDFSGLGGAGINVDDSVPGQVTITFDSPSSATYSGSFGVQPPADSDVDHPTITATASVMDPSDNTLTDSGDSTIDIHVDANADAGPGAVGGTDDGDPEILSITIDDISDDDGSGSFQAGEVGTITVTATFDDFLDGSETHEFTVTAPAGFEINGINAASLPLPDGVTFDLAADGSSITFSLPTDSVDGLEGLTVTLDITNVSAEEGSATFEVSATATETQTGDEECDDSESDNVATVSAEQSVTVSGIAAPTVSINLEGDATYIKEDSVDNVVEFAAATGDASDELTTVVISFPSEIEAGDVDFSGIVGDPAVSNVDVDDNGGLGPVVVTITFNPGVTSFSGDFLLDAPVEDSDVDLGSISIVANVQDQADNTQTDSANASLQIDVDAVLDEALDPGADSTKNETETAAPQTINLGLVAALGSAAFTGSGDGGADTDGSESITVVLVLDNPLPDDVTLSSTGGTVTQDLVGDPTGKTYIITGADLEAAIDGLQVELPASFEGAISGTVTVTSAEANTPEGEVPASGDEPDESDNVKVLSAEFTVNVADGADPTGGQLNLTVDEKALDFLQDGSDLAPGTTFGNNAGSNAETTSGNLLFNAGADPIVDIYFGATGAITVQDEDGNPINVVWSGSGSDTLTGTLNGVVVIVLSLSGDNTAVAGGTATATVTATLTDAFPHADGKSGNVAINGILVSAEDDDGDIGNGTVNVTVLDDEPNDIFPEAAALGSGTGSTFTGDLDFFDNVGADKPGDVVFDPGLHGDILLAADGVTPVTSNGDSIILDVSGDGHTLTGYVESGATAGYQEGEDTKVFTVVLNSNAVIEGADEYTITLFDEIDTGGGLLFDNFGDVSAGGPKEFIALDDPRTGAEDMGEDILITASPESGKVNASTQGVGVANQQVDAGETIRVDFVSNVVGLTDATPGIKDDLVNLTYSGHRTVNDSGFQISQDFGPTTVTVKALDADDDKDFGGDPDDIQRNITLVTVISATGVVLLDHVAANASNGGVSVTFNGDGTVTVSGLLEDYQVLVSTSEGFDALEITAVGSKFDLGGITTSSAQAGEPVDLSFDVIASDEDGDTSSGTIEATVLPQIDGGPGAENLMAGPNGGNIQAGGGNDTLVGNGGNDLLQGEDGADTISDGAGNDTIIGGNGADIINLANDGDTDILVYNSIGEAGDVVTGFNTAAPNLGGAGGDVIDLVDLLDTGTFVGTTLAEAQAGGYVNLNQVGGNVEVRVDLNGGGDSYTTIVTVNTVTVADLADNIVVD